ncbi:MAG: hypothetical protein ACKOK8_00125 [Planctomycetia bacterium]
MRGRLPSTTTDAWQAATMLERPLLTPLVLGFWLVTTGWLVVAKILPALSPGSPPGHQALYTTGNRPVPVAWTVQFDDRAVGWAIATGERSAAGGMTVATRLRIDHLPLDEMLPPWLGLLVRRAAIDAKTVAFDARGRLDIDPAGRLAAFSSRVALPASSDDVELRGVVDDGAVRVTIAAGGMHYETTRHLPTHVVIGDELSPQATLPGLYEGRRWTVPTYSPLRPGHAPLEILHAHVGPEETVFWENGLVRAHVVTYRDDPTSDREPRCRLWVDRTGRVLRQETMLLGTRVTFVRRSDEAAAWLAADEPAATAGDGSGEATP